MQQIAEVLKQYKQSPAQTNTTARPVATACAADCPYCGGIGLVRYDYPHGHEYFGRMFPCPNLPKHQRHVLHPCGLYQDEIDTLDWDGLKAHALTGIYKGKGKATDARRIAQSIRDYLASPGLVFLSGGPGLGKTRIAKTLIAERIRAGKPAIYKLMPEILEDIKQGFDATNPRDDAKARMDRYTAHEFLCIDELDKVMDTEWVSNTLWRLLNSRYELAEYQRATTLIVSNERPEALPPALVSRMRDGRCYVVELEGEDIRPRMGR